MVSIVISLRSMSGNCLKGSSFKDRYPTNIKKLARTKQNIPWVKREDFRDIYERLVEFHINKALKEKVLELDGDVPEWVKIAVHSTLDELELDLDE